MRTTNKEVCVKRLGLLAIKDTQQSFIKRKTQFVFGFQVDSVLSLSGH